MNVSKESLEKVHGKNAAKVFAQICLIGGFGDVDPNEPGGLDISGVDGKAKAEIEALITGKNDTTK